jgi:hypothetical protein
MAIVIITAESTIVRGKQNKEITLPSLKAMNETQEGFIQTLKMSGVISSDENVLVNRSYH